MTRPQDAPLLASLEFQYRELAAFAARAERLRAELVPPPSAWHGAARRAFDAGMQGVTASLDDALATLRSAHGHTGDALMEVHARV